MRRKDAYRLSVFLAVIGLTLIYFSSLYLSLEEVDIGEIERDWSGRNVEIKGNVTGFTKSSGHAFIDVEDSTGEILVVDFDSDLELERGETVTVTGHVEIYEGKLEIVAKEVEARS